jgi:hypothetical protein
MSVLEVVECGRARILYGGRWGSFRSMLTDEKTVLVARANPAKHMGSEVGDLAPIWDGILHEFRNHLSQLADLAADVKAAASPAAVVPETAQAAQTTAWTIQRMKALLAFVDAAVRGGPTTMMDLDKVIEGALRLAAPALGRVAVSFDKPHRIDVRNRGAALESLTAGLIVELAQAGSRSADPSRRLQIDVHAHVGIGPGTTVLAIDSSGLRPLPGSWRVALAHDLAAQIGATVTAPEAFAGFVIRLDSSS